MHIKSTLPLSPPLHLGELQLVGKNVLVLVYVELNSLVLLCQSVTYTVCQVGACDDDDDDSVGGSSVQNCLHKFEQVCICELLLFLHHTQMSCCCEQLRSLMPIHEPTPTSFFVSTR